MTITQFESIASYSHLKNFKAKGGTDPKKAWEAAKNFENMFVSHFIQQMFAANKEGLFGGGQCETMFRSIWAEKIAATSDMRLGIAESVVPTLLRNQGK